jgi:hypothetical protein
MEWVAYRLDRLLGLDLVPPVAYRAAAAVVLPLRGAPPKQYEEGAVMYFVEGARPLREVPETEWGGRPKDALLGDTRLLDVLLHNSDRHAGHFLLGEHWAAGRREGGAWRGDARPALIDHAAACRAGAVVTMRHDNAFGTGAVRAVTARAYLRLRLLDEATLARELRGVVGSGQVAEMAGRGAAVLRYLDGLVAERGYDAVVVDA